MIPQGCGREKPEPPAPSLSEHMEKREGTTYQLSLGEVLLPPEVLVHGWEHRQPVVGVHENVDETVQGRSKEACGSGVCELVLSEVRRSSFLRL